VNHVTLFLSGALAASFLFSSAQRASMSHRLSSAFSSRARGRALGRKISPVLQRS